MGPDVGPEAGPRCAKGARMATILAEAGAIGRLRRVTVSDEGQPGGSVVPSRSRAEAGQLNSPERDGSHPMADIDTPFASRAVLLASRGTSFSISCALSFATGCGNDSVLATHVCVADHRHIHVSMRYVNTAIHTLFAHARAGQDGRRRGERSSAWALCHTTPPCGTLKHHEMFIARCVVASWHYARLRRSRACRVAGQRPRDSRARSVSGPNRLPFLWARSTARRVSRLRPGDLSQCDIDSCLLRAVRKSGSSSDVQHRSHGRRQPAAALHRLGVGVRRRCSEWRARAGAVGDRSRTSWKHRPTEHAAAIAARRPGRTVSRRTLSLREQRVRLRSLHFRAPGGATLQRFRRSLLASIRAPVA